MNKFKCIKEIRNLGKFRKLHRSFILTAKTKYLKKIGILNTRTNTKDNHFAPPLTHISIKINMMPLLFKRYFLYF